MVQATAMVQLSAASMTQVIAMAQETAALIVQETATPADKAAQAAVVGMTTPAKTATLIKIISKKIATNFPLGFNGVIFQLVLLIVVILLFLSALSKSKQQTTSPNHKQQHNQAKFHQKACNENHHSKNRHDVTTYRINFKKNFIELTICHPPISQTQFGE